MKLFWNLIIILPSFMVSIYAAINCTEPGYNMLALLPSIYALSYFLFIRPVVFKRNSIFVKSFTIISFFRYVVLTFFIVISKYYYGRSVVNPTIDSLEKAIFLMMYEIIIASILIFILYRKNKKNINEDKTVNIPNNFSIYIIFIIITFILTLSSPEALKTLSFIKPSKNAIDIGNQGGISTIVTYCMISAKMYLYIIGMSVLYKKYKKNNKKIYIILSVGISLLNILIFFGDNRSDIIMTAIATIIVFNRIYNYNIKKVIFLVSIVLFIIISGVTEHRQTVTVSRGTNKIIDMTDTLQVYLGGPYNVSMAIETAKMFPEHRNLLNLTYDLLRPTIGFNIFMKKIDMPTSSELYNKRIYYSDHRTQIIPMIGQGYYFLGFIFSPVIMIFFLSVSKYLNEKMENKTRIELIYLFTIVCVRYGFMMGQNGIILMNDTSFLLVLNGILYYLNNKIKLAIK